MNFNLPSPEKDANSEKPTIRNVNAALAVLGLVRGMDITVSLNNGETVKFEKSPKPENADAVALKLWRAYGVEVLKPSED